ncbi:MAG: hypothetical protein R3D44_05325 [Hyphomicrobiaceae bacterium]
MTQSLVRRCVSVVVALVLGVLDLVSAAAAVRFKRSGEATLGGADALAGVQSACEAGRNHVWVEVVGRGDCVAFYPTPGLNRGKAAVFYFEGDIPPSYRHNRKRLQGHLASLQGRLDRLAATYQVPYVMVARPGTFGSTGNHSARRKDREFLVMRAAVDAIRQKFELKRIALAGQSGGATIAGALLVLGMSDVACAVPASGGYDLKAMLDWHADRQGIVVGVHREHPATLAGDFNVMDRVQAVRQEPGRRIFVVGDPGDQVTPFVQQQRFAERLRADGHHAQLVRAQGSGPQRHGLAGTALKMAGLCVTGADDAEVRRAAKSR